MVLPEAVVTAALHNRSQVVTVTQLGVFTKVVVEQEQEQTAPQLAIPNPTQ
jgi:hypothetical protein